MGSQLEIRRHCEERGESSRAGGEGSLRAWLCYHRRVKKSPEKKGARKRVKKTAAPAARERLLLSAEKLFAERGYNGVSVRDIAAAAKVNIGTIPYYFGTKEKLLQEVFQRLVGPLIEERRSRIEAVYAEAGDGVPDIRRTLEAALEPVFRRSRTSDTYRRLAGRSSTDPTLEVRRVLNKIYNPSNTSVHQALRRACPHLSRKEFYWRFFCFHGAVQYVLADVGRIQAIAGRDFDTSQPEVTLRYVIPFLAAGMLTPGVDPPDAPSVARRPVVRRSRILRGKA
jgi:AcrR family transcriptional regulator